MSIHKKISLIFGGLTLGAIILSFFALGLSFYKATIFITAKPEDKDISFTTTLTGRHFEETMEGEKEYAVSGMKTLQGYAQGKIKVVNQYSTDQPLVETTRFLSEQGVLFRSTQRILVPAGGETEVEIRAVEKGLAGNVQPGKFTIPGLFEWKQQKIYGISDKPMTGGLIHVGTVSRRDIDKAKKELQDQLFAEFLKKIPAAELKNQGLAKYQKVNLFSCTARAGDEVGQFTVKMKLRVALVALNEESLLETALKELKRQIPEGKALSTIAQESFKYWVQSYNSGEAQIGVSLSGQMVLTAEAPILADKTKLAGLSPEEVKNYLENFPEIEKVEVKISPFWTKVIPKSEKHIEIVIRK